MQYRRAPSTTPQAPVGCTPAIKTGMNSMNYTTPRLSELLAAHNAGYVLVEAGGKRPIQRNWQRSPVPLAAAWRHAADGGNIGLLGGTGNLVILDADRDAERVEDALPSLRSTLKIFRRNAPDRAKWIVRVAGALPASRKAAELEILGAGRQAVIVGRHDSGALIEHTGTAIVDLTPAELESLWERVTGSTHSARAAAQASPAAQAVQSSPARTEAAQVSMARAEAVLAALGIERSAWRAKGAGWLMELESCPFVAVGAEPGRQHSVPRKSFVRVAADGTLGAGCQSTRCQHAIEASGASGWRLLSSLAGERQPGTDVAGIIERLRHFVRRADLADYVPSHLQAANGYRTRDTDVAVADAILDIAEERGRIDRLPLGLRDVRARAGLGSANTAAAAIARLDGWLLRRVEREGRRPWEAELYDLVMPSGDHVAHIARYLSKDIIANDPKHEQQRAMCATSPLRTHRADDAFCSSLTNLTEAELDRRCAERDALIAAGAELRPIRRSRYWRRLQAALPCAGRGVLRLLDALAEEGGVCSRARLRVLLNIKTATLSRLVARAHLLGLVAADRRQVALNSDWQATVDATRQHMPSAGRLEEIAEREDNERLAWLQKAARRPDLSRSEATRLHRSIERTAARRRVRAEEERPDLTVRHADVPSTTAGQLAVMARLADRTAVAHLDAAEARNAEQWRLVREIGTLRRDGVSRRQTRRYLEMAGWQRREVYSALASAWPVAQEAV